MLSQGSVTATNDFAVTWTWLSPAKRTHRSLARDLSQQRGHSPRPLIALASQLPGTQPRAALHWHRPLRCTAHMPSLCRWGPRPSLGERWEHPVGFLVVLSVRCPATHSEYYIMRPCMICWIAYRRSIFIWVSHTCSGLRHCVMRLRAEVLVVSTYT